MRLTPSRSKSKRSRSTPRVAGLELTDHGHGVELEGGELVTLPSGRLRLEGCDRVFAWNAEAAGVHFWCDLGVEAGRSVRGWFGGGRVSTLGIGASYVFSASRWLADPIESAEELRAFGLDLQKGCAELGLPLKGSPGSAALALWKRLADRSASAAHTLNEFAEPAIYGGRAELVRPGWFRPASQWDRASAYLSHLAEPLPLAGSERWTYAPDLKRPGITEALVTAPRGVTPFPVLPVRVELGPREARTVYPWGRFVGRWSNEELQAARDRGYGVKPLFGCAFGRVAPHGDLERFARVVWDARKRWPMAKRLGVALVGKLHTTRQSRVVVPFGPFRDLAEAMEAARAAGFYDRGPDGELRSTALLVGRARVAVLTRRQESFPWHTSMAVAAIVLARARLELLRLMEANASRVLAVATDGAILDELDEPAGVELGGGLGEWRLDYRADVAHVLGPTCYLLQRKGEPDKVRSAGVARALAAKFLAGGIAVTEARRGILAGASVGNSFRRSVSSRSPEVTGAVSIDDDGKPKTPVCHIVKRWGGRLVNRIG